MVCYLSAPSMKTFCQCHEFCPCRNACYLLDNVIKAAFPYKDGLVTMETAFQDAFQVL